MCKILTNRIRALQITSEYLKAEAINARFFLLGRLLALTTKWFTLERESPMESTPLQLTWMVSTSTALATKCHPWLPKMWCLVWTLGMHPRTTWREMVSGKFAFYSRLVWHGNGSCSEVHWPLWILASETIMHCVKIHQLKIWCNLLRKNFQLEMVEGIRRVMS